MLINRRLHKQIVADPGNGILLRNKKGITTDTHNIIDKAHSNYAEWIESVKKKEYTLYDSFSIKF